MEGLKMRTTQEILDRIVKRVKTRKILAEQLKIVNGDVGAGSLLLFSEGLDDYLEHRIQADKTLEGLLQDIRGEISSGHDHGNKTD